MSDEMVYVRMTPGPGQATTGMVVRVPKEMAETWVAQGEAEYTDPPAETARLKIGRADHRPKGRGRGVEQR